MLNEFISYFKDEKKSIWAMMVYAAMSSLLVLMIPFFIQILIQQYMLMVWQPSTVLLVLIVTVFLLGITVMRILQMQLSEYFQRRIFLKTLSSARRLAHKEQTQDGGAKKLNWNYIFEAVSLQKTIIPLFFDGFTFLLQSILVICLISLYHTFFIVYSAFLIFAFYWVCFVMGKKTFHYSLRESASKHKLIYDLEENNGWIDDEKTFLESTENYFQIRQIRHSYYLRQSIGLFLIKIVAAVILLSVGGLLIFQKQMTIGELIASELIVTNLLISLFKFSSILDYFYDSMASFAKLKVLQGADKLNGIK